MLPSNPSPMAIIRSTLSVPPLTLTLSPRPRPRPSGCCSFHPHRPLDHTPSRRPFQTAHQPSSFKNDPAPNLANTHIAPSSRPIPSFVPSNRTLEFRIVNDSPASTPLRLRRMPGDRASNISASSWSTHQPCSPLLQSHNRPGSIWADPSMTVGDPVANIRDTIDRPPRSSSRREDNWTIRCTEIDENGNIITSRSMSKSEICAHNRIQPRDLRKIDSRISNVVPSILVRDEAIIFNVLNIRALVKANSIIIFDNPSTPSVSVVSPSSQLDKSDKKTPVGGAKAQQYTVRSAFLHNLLNNLRDEHRDCDAQAGRDRARQNELPYEFRAIETMLSSVATSLESELGVLRTLVSSLLDGLEQNIEREKLKQLLLYSRRLSTFNSRALLVQQCLDEILENDPDMANSYLSEKNLHKSPRQPDDHEEFEQLLESFSKYVEEIVHEGKSILTNIKSTEEIIELILDSNRNTLLALDLRVSIATMGLGIGAFTAGLFGMNLRTNMEHDPYAFFIVTGLSLSAVVFAIGYGWRRLYRLRRVGLGASGLGHGHEGRSGWRRADGDRGGLLDWDVPSSSLGWKESNSGSGGKWKGIVGVRRGL